jgi:hypothetical protein
VSSLLLSLLLGPGELSGAQPPPALDTAFTALAQYQWGPARDALAPIDVALITSHGNEPVRTMLETRLLGVLEGEATTAGKMYVCRQLAWIGTGRSVPALSRLLDDPQLGNAARSVHWDGGRTSKRSLKSSGCWGAMTRWSFERPWKR